MRRAFWTVGLATLVAIPLDARAQGSTEIIRGRVFGPDSLPVAQAEVLVTGLISRAVLKGRTDDKGVYTVLFGNPENEYIVAVRKVGFVSTSFRVSRTGVSNVLTTNVYLKAIVQQLDTVIVRDRAAVVAEQRSVGELTSSALADSIFLRDPTRLMELLLSIPGVYLDGDSVSIAGAAANMNISTLDGTSFRGGQLPLDAISTARILTSSADPARGGFAGSNTSTTLRGGTDIFASTLRLSTSNPSMAWSDPKWTQPVSRSVQHSGTINGPIKKQILRYNVSWDVRDNSMEWYSLLNPREPLLSQQGVRLDTVAAVRSVLDSLGIPVITPNIPRNRGSRGFSMSDVFDYTPSATTSARLSYNMNWDRNNGQSGNALTAFPTRSNMGGFAAHRVGGKFSTYVRGLLNETNFGINTFQDHSDPYTLLPSASVRVGTTFEDGRTGLTPLAFGGGQGHYAENTAWLDLNDEVSWLPANGLHRLKAGAQLNLQRSRHFWFPGSNLLGNYTYLTIDDLAANRPASYDRVLTNTPRYTKARNSAFWVGEEWNKSKAFQMQGGVRFDFSHPITTPRYNPDADAVFGVRTDRVPDDVGMTPRLGFSWSSKARQGKNSPGGSATLGGLSASAVGAMPSELVTSLVSMQRANTLPGIGVTGTIGGYRGVIGTGQIAELVETTGLPGTRINISCVGDAVPIPDWQNMLEGPTACADGTTGTTFSIAQPLVRVFDPGFQAPLSWRGNLGIDGIRIRGQWIVGLSTVLAYNVNGQSTIDVNMIRTPGFLLANEGNRPVYVPVSAVPATGSISPAASRISPQFSTVSTIISDLRGYSTSLQATLTPPRPLFHNRVSVNLTYALARGASETRGTSRAGIAGDPFVKEWVRTSQPLHMFRLTSSGRIWWFNFALSSFIQSGVPISPLVSGDINGDGNSNNDRAFIPDPATTPDTTLARQMRDLLAHTPSGARRCLTSQFGRMASANSCRTPWQGRIDFTASVTPPSGWNYNDRLRLTMNVHNASGGLVRALNLENTLLGRSSLSTNPNQTLLYVTGFDTAAQRFTYRVNQLFGQPANYGSARRRFGPTQVQVGFEYKFGGPPINPIARGLGLREPAGLPPLTDEQRRIAVAKLKRNPVIAIVERRDSLALNAEQIAQLENLSREYQARADTALVPLTRWVVRKGRRVADQDLQRRLSEAQSALGKVSSDIEKRAHAVLTADQRTLLGNAPKER